MMGHQKQSHWINTLFENNHATNFFIVFFSLLFLVPYAAAQTGDAASSSPQDYVMANNLKVSPPMAIILVGLITTFFMLGCFSVYARRCFENIPGNGLAANEVNRRSRRATIRGLDPSVLDTFPTFLYSDVKGLKIGKAALECAVCLNEFEDEETLRLLPKCCHVFHPECIDTWLISHVTCPVCRANLVPVPGEENDFDVLSRDSATESTQPTQPPEAQNQAHEISELAIDLHIGSPEVIELSQSTNQNRPPRSTPKMPLVDGKFPRSHSTGHSLIQPGEDCERFTLRLPEEVQKKLNKPELRRAKSNVALPTARSSKKGYRSASVRTGRENSNHAYYEPFNRDNRPDRWGLTMNPPFIPRSHSVQLPKEGVSGHNLTASGSLLKSVKVPFDRLFGVTEKDDVGERSFTKLMGNSPV